MNNIKGFNQLQQMIIKRGDIFFVDLGTQERGSSIQGGDRPCVIVQLDIGNKFSPTVVVVPLTSEIKKENMPTHVVIDPQFKMKYKSMLLTEQITTIDKSKLKAESYIGRVYGKKLEEIDRALMVATGTIDLHERSVNNPVDEIKERRESNIKKQVDEVVYWNRNILELLEDTFAKDEQISQRKIRLQIEYNKLAEMCSKCGLNISDYCDIDIDKTVNTRRDKRGNVIAL